ncbi:nuclear transport factor 2 family protein [Neolewinella antarctica]|uniref:Intracellular protease/amidase n=1 Tax=Neolewinella antarctica TaxID=442734 RepID=A0ABX0XFJ6_9BACT|nr:nuclear transport factor 2 family protein [Neolewinella antarctica]NJC27643.1 putative intracellular protease/amidase [Neolewinella antarctica]
MRFYFFLLTLLFCTTTLAAQDLPYSEEEVAIRVAVQKYIDGRNLGKPELLRETFHPNADIRIVKEDTLYAWPIGDYIDGVTPGKQQDCMGRIIKVDYAGAAAMAHVEIQYPGFQFADYLNLLKLDGQWIVAVKSAAGRQTNPKRVLFVVTSHEKLGDTGRKTGAHLGEISHAYKPLHDAGYSVDFASPRGGSPFLYGADLNDPLNLWFVQNASAWYALQHAATPAAIDPEGYAAIYFVGGSGTMWDFPDNAELQSFVRTIYENDGLVAGVCHGPAGLVNVTLSDGSYLVDGKRLTSFTDSEELGGRVEQVVPFLLETVLRERGAIFTGKENYAENMVVDGRLVTGQNPASAGLVGRELVRLLGEE